MIKIIICSCLFLAKAEILANTITTKIAKPTAARPSYLSAIFPSPKYGTRLII